ncbi:unnamed protein product [Owenia fusiformis]|uniref:Cadherin-like beta-sandwich-like domain-containing protein n=1 Tax=Owenia fusiformis TaxID=6347 RepID=A0A8S4PDY1_OWEFU|nr:unnamed protein product [Owenia fusiformis]
MDDCDLEKLNLKPAKFTPSFNKNVTEYHATLPSDVDKVTFDVLTSDTGASYSISGSDGGKTVPLKEGVTTDVKIEVTSEDGTIKNYFVHIKRLSGKDASLIELKLSDGILQPEFASEHFEYCCLLPCHIKLLSIAAKPPDVKCPVTVNNATSDTPVSLNIGESKIDVAVKSADGSVTQVYTIIVTRKPFPRYVKFIDPNLSLKYEDPISLAALYCPIRIKDSEPPHMFSGPLIYEITKTSKFDPLNEMPLENDWKVSDYATDEAISNADASIPLVNGGCSDAKKFTDLGELLKTCGQKVNVEDKSKKFKTDVQVQHDPKVCGWEKQLQQIFDESNPMKLCTAAKQAVEKYFAAIASAGHRGHSQTGESPIEHLDQAAYCYATALKYKPKDPNLHVQLGLVLEEKYFAEDLLGLKKEENDDFPSLNVQAKEGSREEECGAICKLHGCDAKAPLSLQLKAIDKEYQTLINSGQSEKADHVQFLFAWKSKQATQEGLAAQKASDDTSCLGQAYLKYMDALALDDTKAVYNFHVGRLLVMQGNYDDAIVRLEVTLGLNAQHQLARSYLGLALALRKEGAGSRSKEAIGYLQESMESLIALNTEAAMKPEILRSDKLRGESPLVNTNVYLLRGIIQLGRLVAQTPEVKDTCMSAADIFHTAALFASATFPTVAKGDTYKQLQWILLDAHSNLLELLSLNPKGNEKLIALRCERLSAFIKCSAIPTNENILALQEKTCQQLVQNQPSSSHALYLLGSAQLSKYDDNPEQDGAEGLLNDAKASFRASLGLEGKMATTDIPSELMDQQWWKKRLEKEKEEQKKATPATATNKGGPPSRGGAAGVKGGATAGRGGAVRGRGGATTPARGGTTVRGGRGAAAAARGARGGAATRPAAAGKVSPVKPAAKAPTGKTSSSHVCSPAKPTTPSTGATKPTTEPETVEAKDQKVGPVNKATYHPRLGLARALSRLPDNIEESQKYYEQVIHMAPDIHDAYVELANMLMKSSPLKAVDVYCKFPIPETPSFDDAFIFGEIVQILMKHEQYDDPRLGPNMISYGKVLGLAALEKYVDTLSAKFKHDLCKQVYAGIHGKPVDDPDLTTFFKFKCWM